jgi:peptide/nickel transport system substrate-binding protein
VDRVPFFIDMPLDGCIRSINDPVTAAVASPPHAGQTGERAMPSKGSLASWAAAAVLLFALAGAGAPPAFAASSNEIINVVEPAEPKFLDMTQDPGRVAMRTGSVIIEPLVFSDSSMTLVPGLATSWERAGEKVWRFKLRKGVRFHNGEEFNAEAVRFSIERSKKGNYGSYYADIENIVTPDPYTVEIHTTSPTSVTPAIMSVLWIVPPKHVQQVGDAAFGKAPVGTGPFRFKEWAPGKSLTFVRNDDYWGDKAKVGGVKWTWSAEPSARTSLLLAGNADVAVNVNPQETAEIEANKNTKVIRGLTNRTVYIFFDMKSPIVNDIAIRKAVAHLVDRDAIVKALLGSAARPEKRLLIETIFPAGGANDGKAFRTSVAEAKQILEKAGYASKFPIEIDFHYTQSRHPMEAEVAEAIISAMEKPGFFKVKRHIREAGAHLSLVFTHKIGGMFLYSGGPTWPHPDVTMRTYIGTKSVVHYCEDAELDRQGAAALQLSGKAADAAYTAIESRVLYDLVCMIPLHRIIDEHGVSKRVQGMQVRLNEFINYYPVEVTDAR